MWERGLKLGVVDIKMQRQESLPMWERGLKPSDSEPIRG